MQRRKKYHVSLVVSSTDTAIMEYACEIDIFNVTGMIKVAMIKYPTKRDTLKGRK